MNLAQVDCGVDIARSLFCLWYFYAHMQLKAIIPGGSSTFILGADKVDIPLDFEAVATAGSMLGSGGVVVMNEDTCIVDAVLRMTEFYRDESCGKCTPCREGTYWLTEILHRIERGDGREGDIDLLMDICDNISGKSFCPLGDAATSSITSSIKLFREEYEHHIRHKRCLVGSRQFDVEPEVEAQSLQAGAR